MLKFSLSFLLFNTSHGVNVLCFMAIIYMFVFLRLYMTEKKNKVNLFIYTTQKFTNLLSLDTFVRYSNNVASNICSKHFTVFVLIFIDGSKQKLHILEMFIFAICRIAQHSWLTLCLVFFERLFVGGRNEWTIVLLWGGGLS